MSTIIFNADLNCGSQAFAGSLGIKFNVDKLARVTDLGWFDNGGNGMTGTPTFNVYITTVDGVTTYASTTFSSGDQGTRYDNGPYRFKSITPVILATGTYMLWGYGFNANNLNGNSAILAVNATLVSDGGIISLPATSTFYHGSSGITVPNTGYSTGLQFASFSMMLWAVDVSAYFSGSADVTFTPNTGFNYSASGKAVFGGTDAVSLRLPFDPPRAGMVFGGTTTVKPRYILTPSGNAVFGGTTSNKITIARAAAGNAVFGGSSSVKVTYARAASGNAVFGGSSSFKVTIARAAAGNAVFGGTAGVVLRINSAASGNAVFGGTATVVFTPTATDYTASGNAVFGGSAATVFRINYAAAGNAVFGGTVAASQSFTYSASGNAVFGGSADASAATVYTYSASGAGMFGGAAGVGIGIVYEASGNAVFGGAATVVFSPAAAVYTYTGSGCMYLGGTVFDAPCLTASLTVQEMLSGTLAAVNRLSGTLAATERLQGTLAAVDRLSASLDAENVLSATLGGCQ